MAQMTALTSENNLCGGWEDIYSDLCQISDENQLFLRFTESVQQFGFDYCSYGIRAPLPISNPSVRIFDSYPPGWMTHYRENDFLTIDPTVRLGERSPDLIVWSDQTFASAPRLWMDARDFGLSVGVAQASWAAHGMFGLLTLARSNEPLSTSEVSQLGKRVLVVTNLFHALMCRLLEPKLLPGVQISLTPREREVMRWTGEGKTAHSIGDILNISERTVNFHINNVLAKLNSTNKVQAVVKACLLGLIDPG
jgi:LuxR family quorum-sensing system transcriptional regulator SolR